MSLLTFTCDYSIPPTDCSFLEASCNRVGVTLHKFGQGMTWPSYTDRLRDGAEWLKGRTEDLCLFLDSADTYVLDGEETIVSKFEKFNAPFVFSAEKGCWPDPSLEHHFTDPPPYRFLNAGAWMGEREWIISHWLDVWNAYHSQWGEDDTRCLVQGWIDGLLEGAKIDHNCEIFISYFGYVSGDMDETNYRTNLLKMTTPLCHHFNGRSQNKSLAYERATT